MEKFISTIDGTFYCKNVYDCEIGSMVAVTDEYGNFIGDFKGSLSDYTDDELMDKVDEITML